MIYLVFPLETRTQSCRRCYLHILKPQRTDKISPVATVTQYMSVHIFVLLIILKKRGWCHLDWCQIDKPTSVRHVCSCQLSWQKLFYTVRLPAEAAGQYYSFTCLSHLFTSGSSFMRGVRGLFMFKMHFDFDIYNKHLQHLNEHTRGCHCWFLFSPQNRGRRSVTIPDVRNW